MRHLRNVGLIVLAVSLALVMAAPAVASIAYTLSVVNSSSENYEQIGLAMLSNNTMLAERHYIASNGLDTRVYDGSTAVPHMLTDNATWFVTELDSYQSKSIVYSGGYEQLDSMYIIPGYGGYITTPDNSSIELGSSFEISISGYFDMTAGEDKIIAEKPGVFVLDVSAAGTITFHAKSGGDEDAWTIQATGVESGTHTVTVSNDGTAVSLIIDGATRQSHSVSWLYGAHNFLNAGSVDEIGDTWWLTCLRYNFYYNGLYWQFYRNASKNIAYATSADGDTWSSETAITSDGLTNGATYWAIFFDGTHVHYARRASSDSTRLYRMGTPNSDGTITWLAAEQTINLGSSTNCVWLSVDSSGHAYVSGSRPQGASGSRVYCWKNANNDGTWSTSTGYPFVFSGPSGSVCSVYIVPMLDNKMYALLNETNVVNGNCIGTIGLYYNGSSWAGTYDQLSTASGNSPIMNGVCDSTGTVYLSYKGNLKIRYPDGTFSSEIPLSALASLTLNTADNSVFCFYRYSNTTTKYRVYANGVLGNEHSLTSSGSSYYVSSSEKTSQDLRISTCFNSSGVMHERIWPSWVPLDNEYDYYWMLNNSMPYASEILLTTGGSEVLRYQPVTIIQGDVLPDRAGDRQDGVFHWAIAPLNIDVTASGGWTPSRRAIYTGGATSNVTADSLDIPDMPLTMYTEGDTSKFPGGPAIDEILEESETPKMLWWYPFIFLLIAIAGGLVYEATTARGTAEGSLLTMCIIMEAGLVLFGILGTTGTGSLIPLFPALIAPIPWSAIILSRKHVGWG